MEDCSKLFRRSALDPCLFVKYFDMEVVHSLEFCKVYLACFPLAVLVYVMLRLLVESQILSQLVSNMCSKRADGHIQTFSAHLLCGLWLAEVGGVACFI